MKKYYFIGFSIIFLSPWVHRLAYENIKLAMPDYHDPAGIASGLTGVSIFVFIIFKLTES